MNLFGHSAPAPAPSSSASNTINISSPVVSDISSTPADNKKDEATATTPASSIDSDAKSIKPTPLKDIADLDNLDDIEEYLNSLNG